jgi:ComF family protein
VCARCGDVLDFERMESTSNPANCRACRLAPPAFERAVSFGPYEGRMRSAIHALKYERMRPAAVRLGGMLAQAISTLLPDAPDEMLVIPVPLHRSKHAERGFNQARLLAAHALDALRATHPAWRLTLASSTLMRLRATESQASLTPRKRRRNVRGAFMVSDPHDVAGKHILLVDDVMTTGATARAASKILVQAGAASVWVATLARAKRYSLARRGRRSSYSNLSVEDTNGNLGPRGNAVATDLQPASMHSSSNQSSS